MCNIFGGKCEINGMTGIIYGTTLHVMHIFQALQALLPKLIKIWEKWRDKYCRGRFYTFLGDFIKKNLKIVGLVQKRLIIGSSFHI